MLAGVSESSTFQSSPGHEAECDARHLDGELADGGFNPHPAMRPSATTCSATSCTSSIGFNPHPAMRPSATRPSVSISYHFKTFQSSPGHEAECDLDGAVAVDDVLEVSILTRP